MTSEKTTLVRDDDAIATGTTEVGSAQVLEVTGGTIQSSLNDHETAGEAGNPDPLVNSRVAASKEEESATVATGENATNSKRAGTLNEEEGVDRLQEEERVVASEEEARERAAAEEEERVVADESERLTSFGEQERLAIPEGEETKTVFEDEQTIAAAKENKAGGISHEVAGDAEAETAVKPEEEAGVVPDRAQEASKSTLAAVLVNPSPIAISRLPAAAEARDDVKHEIAKQAAIAPFARADLRGDEVDRPEIGIRERSVQFVDPRRASRLFNGPRPALLYVHSRSVLTLALSVARSLSRTPCMIFYKDIEDITTSFSLDDSLLLTDDQEYVFLNITRFEFVMTFGSLPHKNHIEMVILNSMCKQLGIPTYDMQHGLFQLGISYNDEVRHASFRSLPGQGLPLPIDAVTDKQLTWGGDQGVGYPRTQLAYKIDLPHSKFCAIVTNTNWNLYSTTERARLGNILYSMFLLFPSVRFVWKPHPAELNEANSVISQLFLASPLPANVEVLTRWGSGSVFLEQVIDRCDFGIATAGTSLLDFQAVGKPVVVFDCPSVSRLLRCLPRVDTFGDTDGLVEFMLSYLEGKPEVGKIDTGLKIGTTSDVMAGSLDVSDNRRCSVSDYETILRHLDLLNRLSWAVNV